MNSQDLEKIINSQDLEKIINSKNDKNIWFDMDGTIADLYGVQGWLDMLLAEKVDPYKKAEPLCNMHALARELNRLVKRGYTINVVSWLSKSASVQYGKKIVQAKKQWLKKHLRSVDFTQIDIIPYGTPKQVNRMGILFDDEKQNRKTWLGVAFNPQDKKGHNVIIDILQTL